jgi:nucleotide-binding universal stress UspA family protein
VLRQILVAVDFSEWSRHAAQHALNMTRAIGGGVTLLHVLEVPESGPLDMEAARALLQQLSLLARRPPRCLIVSATDGFGGQAQGANVLKDGTGRQGGVAPAILSVADQLGAELIVIGLRGQGSLSERTLGQVVQRVLLDACIPVQVVPGRAPRPTPDRWSAALTEMTVL